MSFGLGKLGRLGRLGVASGRGTGGGGTGAELTYGSGKKFPIWNSMAGTDKIKSFKLSGYTIQKGMPTPEAPVPLLSVGDGGLKLCISGSETGVALQVVDFGNIVLRSLPNGVCDSIKWDGTNWKHVQRIVSIIIDENTTIQDQLEASNRIVVQVNYTLVTKSSANNTNLCSKISNSASSVPRFHNYPTTIYVVWNSNKPATFEEAKSLIMGAEFCCELAESVETILEGIPAPQTFDNETWFGTPSALVKPYMEATVKVKKAVEFVKDNLVEWYDFAPGNWQDNKIYNKINSEQYIQAHNFADTPDSGAVDNYTQFDGIDDYFTDNNNIDSIFIQIYTTDLIDRTGTNQWLYACGSVAPASGLFITTGKRITFRGGSVSIDTEGKATIINESLWSTGIHSFQGFLELSNKLSLIGQTIEGRFFCKFKLYTLLTYSTELAAEQIEHNLNCFKQFKGVDGDINILLADSNGDLLTDSENYYLTSN